MSKKAEPIILCYSKTGHSRRAAEAFAQLSGADILTLETPRYRFPFLWIPRAILDVIRKAEPKLSGFDEDRLSGAPWVALVGPIWAGSPAPPVRAALARLRETQVPVGLLLTLAGSAPIRDSDAERETVLGRKLVASCQIENGLEGTEEMSQRLDGFLSALRAAGDGAAV